MYTLQSSINDEIILHKKFMEKSSTFRTEPMLQSQMEGFSLHSNDFLFQIDKALQPLDELDSSGALAEESDFFHESKLSSAFDSSIYQKYDKVISLIKC